MKASGNILFCGVGGQGILLASEITAFALLEEGGIPLALTGTAAGVASAIKF